MNKDCTNCHWFWQNNDTENQCNGGYMYHPCHEFVEMKVKTMKKVDYSNYDFPLKAKYVRHKNRIYFSTDCQDGEELTYYGRVEKPNSNAMGYRHYLDSKGQIKLIHINDIVEVKNE